MKQCLKQHEVNNSKNKRAVTLRIFFALHDKTVDCNKNTSVTP